MKKKVDEKRLAIKMLVCIVYLILLTILSLCTYKLYDKTNKIVPWSEVENVDNYSYIDIYKMSEKFAFYEESNTGIHFVIEKEQTGLWHTYLIAINEEEYENYKNIIDYTYERTEKQPDPIRVYGYPVITKDDIKKLAIKNIPNFVPAENEVTITEENYENYLTNSYLDTTKERKNEFNFLLGLSSLSLIIVLLLFASTLLNKDNIVDTLQKKLEDELKKTKRSNQ